MSPERMEIRDYGVRDPGEGEVRVRSEYGAAKHGTEMAFVKGYGAVRGRFDEAFRVFVGGGEPKPGRVGNMFVGQVTDVGPNVAGISEGDRVLAYGPFREVHGVRADRCWRMPGEVSWKSAVCLDPADFAMASVRDGHVRVGDAVAVFGMGAIGLAAGGRSLWGGHRVRSSGM